MYGGITLPHCPKYINRRQNMENYFNDLLKITMERKATDLHLCVGIKPMLRIETELIIMDEMEPVTFQTTESIAKMVLDENRYRKLQELKTVDSSYSIREMGRFRMNFYTQRGSLAIAIRSLPLNIPKLEELGLPEQVKDMALKKKGLVLVTGMTGSGKSTTLASMVQYINENRRVHINTIEDPIEFLHKYNKALVTQKEIGSDTPDFKSALSASLREDPDVIMLGEMRDLDTISNAITGAETGHLLLSTLHTNSAVKSVDRILDTFSGEMLNHVRNQLATTLEGVISQQLIHGKKGGLVLAAEILTITPAVRNLIREGKTHQINSLLQSGVKDGMISMERALANLVKEDKVSKEYAGNLANDKKLFENYCNV